MSVVLPYQIGFNQSAFDAELKKVNEAKNFAQTKVGELQAVNGLTMTDALFQDYFSGNGYATMQAIADQVRANMTGSNETLILQAQDDYRTKYLTVRGAFVPDYIYSYLTLNAGTVEVKQSKVDDLQHYYTQYVNTQPAYDLYLAHKAAVDSYNALITASPRLARAFIQNIMPHNYIADNGTVKFEALNYSELTN